MMKYMLQCTLGMLLIISSSVFADDTTDADFILKTTGIKNGFCLVVGEKDGKLTAALALGSKMYVQGCTKNSKSVQVSRKQLVKNNVATRSSIVFREGQGLPYADNLVNLLVCPNVMDSGILIDEVLRVLIPGGIAVLGGVKGDKFKKAEGMTVKITERYLIVKKSLNAKMGDWTHIKAGADQSYTSDDSVVGPWKEIRWIADPRWGALYLSYGGLVSKGGRIYYKENHASKGKNQWHLVARDAYNGIELWRIKSGSIWGSGVMITDYTLTCDDACVYLVEGNKLIARDGASGKKVKTYLSGFKPKYVTSTGNFLLASTRGQMSALDKATGKVLWSRKTIGHPPADGKTAFVLSAEAIEGVDLVSGTSKWKTKLKLIHKDAEVKYKGGVVYVNAYKKHGREGQIVVLDAKDGKVLWKRDEQFKREVLPYEGEVWCLGTLKDKKTKKRSWTAMVLDSRTGKEKRRLPIQAVAKCFGSRGSADYVMYMNGVYIDRKTGKTLGNKSTRSPCRLGQHPANGLTYYLPHHCDCKVTLRGFLALSKPGNKKWFSKDKKQKRYRLFTTDINKTSGETKLEDWPIYRSDLKRSNSTKSELPANLKKHWSLKFGSTRLTQVTGAYGMVFSAERISGRVLACDAVDGKKRWSFVADGRVEYPPTLYKGMCLFGTGAGSVYCLDAKTGKERWRLRASPTQKFIGDRNRFDSPWPVRGGVLVLKGLAHFSVGRSGSQTGGLRLYGVNVNTGSVVWRVADWGSGDMFLSDGKMLRHSKRFFTAHDGKSPWLPRKKKPKGLLHTTTYLTTVAIVDFMATVEPNLSYKKHIGLSDDRLRGECLAFNKVRSVGSGRYGPGVPGYKVKGNYNKYFMHAVGGKKWNIKGIKQHIMGIVLSKERVYAVGRPISYDPKDKAELWVLSAKDGSNLQKIVIEGRPVYDGLSAVDGKLYLATEDGTLTCYGK